LTLLFVYFSARGFLFRYLFLVVLFLPSAITAYLGFKYNVPLSNDFTTDVLMTNRQEVSAFISYQPVLFLGIFFLFTLALAILFGKFKIDLKFSSKKAEFAANILFFVILIVCFRVNYPTRIYDIAIRRFYSSAMYLSNFLPKVEKLENMNEPSYLDKPLPPGGLLFFHIGESVRADHAPMNGYERNTMPMLMKEFKNGNLFSFPNTISFYKSTRFSILGMITPATIADPVIRSSTFIPHLKKNGVEMAAFFSKSDDFKKKPRYFALGINNYYNSFELAHSVLPQVKTFLSAGKSDKSRFALYQGEGSHVPYNSYDTGKFSIFMPVNFQSNADSTTTNAYDNTIACTDDFIGNIIENMRGQNAVYIYASDHGEIFGDDGYWGRYAKVTPKTNKALRTVLFFIWVSDRFKRENPDKFQALKSNAKNLTVVSHDYLYHTILGFYNIRNKSYSSELDLFSKDAKPFAGPMPEELADITFYGRLKFE
jgi:glucan phosphoethanolaminetransferase (alkaline phosphatase superfamily)